MPFRAYRWIGPYVIEIVLPNDNYIVRCLNTNKTQILHCIRLQKCVHKTPLQDNNNDEELQPDDERVKPQNDLYTISWQVDFDYEVFERRKDNWPDTAISLPNDDAGGRVDYYVTGENERSSLNDNERSSEKGMEATAVRRK